MAYRTAPEPTETIEEPEYIPYGLEEFWKPCKILCLICHVFRGGLYDNEAMRVFERLSVKLRLNLQSKFFKAYKEFANFKPELLTAKDDFENYAKAYKFGAFTELRQEIDEDLKGESPEAIEAKAKAESRQKAFLAYKDSKDPEKTFMDFVEAKRF